MYVIKKFFTYLLWRNFICCDLFFADDSEVEVEDENKVVDEISNEEKSVVDSYNFAQNYAEDTKKHLWCEITFAVSMHYCKEKLLSNVVFSCYCRQNLLSLVKTYLW